MALFKGIKVCGCFAADFPHRHGATSLDVIIPVRSSDPRMDEKIREAWLAGRERLIASGVSLQARTAGN